MNGGITVDDSEIWAIAHQYFNLAKLGIIPYPACICETKLALIIGRDDLPAFKCYTCNITRYLDQELFDAMQYRIASIQN